MVKYLKSGLDGHDVCFELKDNLTDSSITLVNETQVRWIQMYSLIQSQSATDDNFTECE